MGRCRAVSLHDRPQGRLERHICRRRGVQRRFQQAGRAGRRSDRRARVRLTACHCCVSSASAGTASLLTRTLSRDRARRCLSSCARPAPGRRCATARLRPPGGVGPCHPALRSRAGRSRPPPTRTWRRISPRSSRSSWSRTTCGWRPRVASRRTSALHPLRALRALRGRPLFTDRKRGQFHHEGHEGHEGQYRIVHGALPPAPGVNPQPESTRGDAGKGSKTVVRLRGGNFDEGRRRIPGHVNCVQRRGQLRLTRRVGPDFAGAGLSACGAPAPAASPSAARGRVSPGASPARGGE